MDAERIEEIWEIAVNGKIDIGIIRELTNEIARLNALHTVDWVKIEDAELVNGKQYWLGHIDKRRPSVRTYYQHGHKFRPFYNSADFTEIQEITHVAPFVYKAPPDAK